jgi:hypothetical protein
VLFDLVQEQVLELELEMELELELEGVPENMGHSCTFDIGNLSALNIDHPENAKNTLLH